MCGRAAFPLNVFLFADPTKYFGCELGAQTQFDVKNDRYIVNGSHEANKLQDMLDGFIKKFVLCPECENPETDLVNILIVDLFYYCTLNKPIRNVEPFQTILQKIIFLSFGGLRLCRMSLCKLLIS